MAFVCNICNTGFSRKSNRDRHVARIHNTIQPIYSCNFCGATFAGVRQLHKHRRAHAPITQFVPIASALKQNCVIFRKTYASGVDNLELPFTTDKADIHKLLRWQLEMKKSLKVSLVYHIEFMKDDGASENEPTVYELCIRKPADTITHEHEINKIIVACQDYCRQRVDDFIENGSGWVLNEVLATDIELGTCRALNGACDLLSLTNLRSFRKAKSCDRLQNCFYEAVAYSFVKTKNKKVIQRFMQEKLICNVGKSVKVSSIPTFEKANKKRSLKINVLVEEDGQIYPYYVSKAVNKKHHINLLLYKTLIHGELVSHYAYVEDLSLLLRKEYRRDNGQLSYEKTHVCINCLQKFAEPKVLSKHMPGCMRNRPQRVKVPEEGTKLSFEHHNNKFFIPLIGFFDFEAGQRKPIHDCIPCYNKQLKLLKKCTDKTSDNQACVKCVREAKILKEKCKHASIISTFQDPIGYSFVLLNSEKKVLQATVYSGDNAVEKFIDQLLSMEDDLLKLLKTNIKMHMTAEDQINFRQATHCHICNNCFTETNQPVRDHDHLTGIFLGASHSVCNLQRTVDKKIPLLCHNLGGYDSHFLLSKMQQDSRIETLKALPKNTEKIRTLRMNSYCFLDSYSFLSAPMSTLTADLKTKKNVKFEILDQLNLYESDELEKKALLLRKGVFPYEYCENLQQIRQCTTLPPRNMFYSSLTNSTVSEEDYIHAKKVWDVFECKNLCDYMELYCLSDSALLAEICIEFRAEVYAEFELDCFHYISTPQLCFDAMLKMTGVELSLMSDIEQINFVENNIRGGVSFINQRFAKAGKMGKHFTELLYLDANNLYGKAQCEPLPVSDFVFLKKSEFENIDWTALDKNRKTGYIVEVTLKYPKKLHASHNSFPLCPEHIKIDQDMLSPFSQDCRKILNGDEFNNLNKKYCSKKLGSTFQDREKYVLHYTNLKLYLKLGMELVAVHRCLAFTQSAFLKPYIELCAKKRKESTNSFGKELWKLFSNCCFGKTIERIREYIDMKLANNPELCRKWMSSPKFQGMKIISEDLVAIFFKRMEIMLNKPLFLGFCILEHSKRFMYEQYYFEIAPRLNSPTVIFSDTDSLLISCTSKTACSNLDKLASLIDFSNYDKSHKKYNNKYENKLGYWKDELKGRKMSHFVGLRAKTYAYLLENNELKSKCKGITKGYKKNIKFGDFFKCIKSINSHYTNQYHIRSKNHQLQMTKVRKLCYSSFDDKRYVLRCNIHTVPFGSLFCKISEKYDMCALCVRYGNPLLKQIKKNMK